MKHIILTTLLLLAAITGRAQSLADNQRLLGYTLTDDISVSGALVGTAGTYPVGALLDESQLADYAGCHIVGIRFAVSQSIGRTRAFIYKEVDGSLQPVIEQNQRTYEGWNTVMLNGDGLAIEGSEVLLFGFDYVETQAMVDADEGALCGTGNDEDGACLIYGNFGSGNGFYTMNQIGRLCVQLIVDVSALPRHDMAIRYFDQGFRYLTRGNGLDLFMSYANTGRDSITSYQLAYQIDNLPPSYIDRRDTLVSGQQTTYEIETALPEGITPGTHQLSVFISQIQGQPAAESDKHRQEATFVYYEDALKRQKTYLEVYSDQTSPYVPFLNDALGQLATDMDGLAIAYVHKRGTQLAHAPAAYLHTLYAYTTPTFTINRAFFPGENHIAYDMNDYLPVLPSSMIEAIIGDMVVQDSANPAFATVDLTPAYDPASRMLTITAEGRLHPQAEAIFGRLALTLLVTENKVRATQSVYNAATQRTSTSTNYEHPSVLRAYLTSPYGDTIVPDDQLNYRATFQLELPTAWNAANLEVVGLLARALPEALPEADRAAWLDANALQMDITNANSVALKDVVTGISAHSATPSDAVQAPAYYSLDGRPVAHPRRGGVYLVRQPGQPPRKVVLR